MKKAQISISPGSHSQAEKILEKVYDILQKTEMKTDSAVYHCTLGELLAAKGSMEEAFQNFETGTSELWALEARPALARAYKSFGRLLKKMKPPTAPRDGVSKSQSKEKPRIQKPTVRPEGRGIRPSSD